jgi:putative ubiquitin-RnfH superfamily antitoxin RatB of RatAB toxin-antitoxin module
MGRDEPGAPVRVSVVFSPGPGEVDEVALELPAGATVAQALDASALRQRHPQCNWSALAVGVWGVPCRRDRVLREHDRVEVYRALVADPMESRRRRQKTQAAGGR